MHYRTLGKTGIRVSEIGFGAWQLGNTTDWAGQDDSAAIALVHQALDCGVNFFDTAPGYAGGKSEELLGQALRGRRQDAVITTKFGHHPDGTSNFDVANLRASVERSLRKLGTDHLDVLLLHSPPMDILGNRHGHFDALARLKQEGLIRAYGASVDFSHEIDAVLTHSQSEVLEVMLNVFHQDPLKSLPLIQDSDVGVIVKVPLDSGWLSGKYHAASSFQGVRGRWTAQDIERRAGLLEKVQFMTDDGATLAQAAIRFLLTLAPISTVIPGNRNSAQLLENIAAGEAPMAPDVAQKLRDFWQVELKEHPLVW